MQHKAKLFIIYAQCINDKLSVRQELGSNRQLLTRTNWVIKLSFNRPSLQSSQRMSSFAESDLNESDEFEQDEIDRAIAEHGISSADLEKMATMEKDMESSVNEAESSLAHNNSPKASSGAFLPPGARPTTKSGALGTHANEFWFPECRNCPCCRGFKHGCKCRTPQVTSCQDPNCKTNVVSQQEVKIEEQKPRHKSVVTFKNKDAPATPAPATAAPVIAAAPTASVPAHVPAVTAAPSLSRAPPAIDTNADNRQVCTYFATPRGCQYGAACRFKHERVTANGNHTSPTAAIPSPIQAGGSPSAGGLCHFFAAGNCRAGAACRFSHS